MGTGYIKKISGPVISVENARELAMHEMVYAGREGLVGEVISIDEEEAVIAVYENTRGLMVGEEVTGTASPLSVELGPGLMGNIFDGIARPLSKMAAMSGAFIGRGLKADTIDHDRKWSISILARVGERAEGGKIIAETCETEAVTHHIMIPPGICGEIVWTAQDGEYTVSDTLVKVRTDKGDEVSVSAMQKWPIRVERPVNGRMTPEKPLITGQRVIDSLFPIAKGGAAAIPGGFGTGKTMTQHQIAKWSDADIIVYIGCGERGNEMTQVLEDFKKLADPRTGRLLMDRTVLIANTSNMPVAAREASIYTGITIAEYYRDMGYHVALMADSTSRWAEALREISGRLEEMPAEEGFPAYLPSRLAEFYERAGYCRTLSGNDGSVSIIGTVSPQGGDFSEPVTQNTKRYVRAFWALDRSLAYSRHYPAIEWLSSYSEYVKLLEGWYVVNAAGDFASLRAGILRLLREESSLMEIVKLIGADVLPEDQKLILETARVIRLGFLQQNAYHKNDTFVPIKKQCEMMRLIIYLHDQAKALVDAGLPVSVIREEGIFEDVVGAKYNIPNDNYDESFRALYANIEAAFKKLYETQL